MLPRQILVNTNAKALGDVMFIMKGRELGDRLPLFSDKYRMLVKNKKIVTQDTSWFCYCLCSYSYSRSDLYEIVVASLNYCCAGYWISWLSYTIEIILKPVFPGVIVLKLICWAKLPTFWKFNAYCVFCYCSKMLMNLLGNCLSYALGKLILAYDSWFPYLSDYLKQTKVM